MSSSKFTTQIAELKDTVETITTAETEKVGQTRSYQTIPSSLPKPTTPTPPDVLAQDPTVSFDYTIPHDELDPVNLPFGTDEYDSWREWRSKYSTISALYVLAAELSGKFPNHQPVHVMFSPPQERVTSSSSIRYWRARATEIAEELNISGGVSAFHGFRVHDKVAQELESHIKGTEFEETATDVLLWEWLRTNDWRQFVEWGPHIHILGLANDLKTYSDEGIVQCLRRFDTEQSIVHQIAAHRAVTKDIVDHLTFHPERSMPPLSWFGELQDGNDFANAKQYVSDARLDEIREVLINGPKNPDNLDNSANVSHVA